jgi:hypothetical protein
MMGVLLLLGVMVFVIGGMVMIGNHMGKKEKEKNER